MERVPCKVMTANWKARFMVIHRLDEILHRTHALIAIFILARYFISHFDIVNLLVLSIAYLYLRPCWETGRPPLGGIQLSPAHIDHKCPYLDRQIQYFRNLKIYPRKIALEHIALLPCVFCSSALQQHLEKFPSRPELDTAKS